MRLSLWILGLLICGLFACQEKPPVDPQAELDTYLQTHFPPEVPGGVILVRKADSTLFSGAYGLADIETGERLNTRSLFNLGSISKTFVANAILILQSRGQLSVEDSLIKYFPDFKNPEIGRKVKIKHLLTHTSGLPDNRNVSADSVFYLTAKDQENWAPELVVDSLLFEPGSQFAYSNPAYNGLALIVEQVSGMKWQEFVTQNIFRPSGMVKSLITDGPFPSSGVVHGYQKVGLVYVEDDYGEEPTFAAAGNGGVWSSADELIRYERALRQGRFLSSVKNEDAQTVKTFPNWAGEAPPAIGWSWFIGQTEEGLKTVGHTGSQGGFRANYVTIPEKKIFFVILCNTPKDISAMTDFITNWLRKNKHLD